MKQFELHLHLGLPIITDHGGQKLLIDTGSPVSFCESGEINLTGQHVKVPKSYLQANAAYLQENLQMDIDGLIGLNILCQSSFTIDYQAKSFIIYDLDDESKGDDYDLYFPTNPSFLQIPVMINNQQANIILDTGAHISYINPEFVHVDKNGLQKTMDFNPVLGRFEVSLIDDFTYQLGDTNFMHEMGLSTPEISNILKQLKVSGVFGFELFRRIVLQYNKQDNKIGIRIQ
jgi:hypothetical protein